MANDDDTARILVELAKLSAGQDAIRKEGLDRGKRTEANLKIITDTVRTQGERLAVIEERQAHLEQSQHRANSGFHRAVRGASETDAKLASDQAAVVIALRETQSAVAKMGDALSQQSTAQTSALGSLVVRSIQGMNPSTRAKLGDAALKFFFALAILIGVLANYLQSKGH